MPQIFSIKISDNIAAFLSASEPVVALNLMGLTMLSDDHFNPNRSVFWCDGVMAMIACKLAKIEVGRKPGRTRQLKHLSISVFMNHSGRLLFWVQRGQLRSLASC